MANPMIGGCECGAIRYEITAAPMMAGHCQCRNCQKNTGTGHASLMMFPKAAVRITGKATEHSRKADSGNTVTRGFCPSCGSPIYGRTSGVPDGITIMAGSLDDPSRFNPQFHVYASRGQAWDKLDAQLPRFDLMPPMPA